MSCAWHHTAVAMVQCTRLTLIAHEGIRANFMGIHGKMDRTINSTSNSTSNTVFAIYRIILLLLEA